ncbi:MAG: protein phosphatase 2C domain-containing protein [Chloroflexi bacterium]|nr:protein phosphatase 2C domain-containing protein [Chloroflexota bacterium]
MNGKQITIGYRTDIGQLRASNQDALFVFSASAISSDPKPYFGLFIVADGAGGYDDGEKASGLATKIISQHILTDIYTPLLKDKFEFDSGAEPLTDVLTRALQEANRQVRNQVPGAGTTVTAVAMIGYMAYIAHVGDSRAYIISSGDIEQITRDHSLVQRLLDLGQLTPEEAAVHPHTANVLYRAIGQDETLDADMITHKLLPGSYLLICSDGLWNHVDKNEILSIVLNNGTNTSQTAQTLVDLANERGGSDNISVILVSIPE